MKNKKRVAWLLILTLMFVMMFSMVAFATDENVGIGNDAVEDILKNRRYGGALEYVDKIGGLVDEGFVAFISFVSFFIISAACLRSVLAGAYCVFPKFWDKVDEAHKAHESITISSIQSYFTGGGWKNTSSGSITQFLLGCLPNVKVLTDFENAQDPDYKQYFMRAIPQCVLAVFMGVFIYNGYYRDVMTVTSQFGSNITLSALRNVKPDEIVYKLTNISGIPDYPIKGASNGTDKFADQFIDELAGYVLGKFQDQSERANKEKFYAAFSDYASQYFASTFAEFSNTNIWEMSIDSCGISDTQGTAVVNDTDMVKERYIVMPVGATGVVLNTEYFKGETKYMWARVTFRNVGASTVDTKASVNDFILHVPADLKVEKNTNSSGKSIYAFSISGTNSKNEFKQAQSFTIDGASCTISGSIVSMEQLVDFNKGGIIPVSGLNYYSNGKSYSVIGIQADSSGDKFTLSSSTAKISLNVGDSVADTLQAAGVNIGNVSQQVGGDDSEEDDSSDLLEGAD